MRINPQTRTLRRPPPKKPAIVASTMAKKKAAKVAATKTLDALKNVVKTKVDQNKKTVVLAKKLNINPKKLAVGKKAVVKKVGTPKAAPKKIVQKKVVQEPKKKLPTEKKLPTQPNKVGRAKNIKHKVVVTIVENQSDLFARDDVVTVKEFSKRGNSLDKAHVKSSSPVRNEIIKKIAQKVINTKPKSIPKLIKNVSKNQLGKNHTLTTSRVTANDRVQKTKLNKQLKLNKDKIIVSESKPIEIKNEIKLTKDLKKNEEINKTVKSAAIDIDIDRVKRETIEKLLREANESLSRRPNKKKNPNKKSKNKTKSNAEQTKKSDIKTAVDIDGTSELKLESGSKNTTEIATSKGFKEIKQSNKKLKESAEIIKEKTQPTTVAPQSVRKVIKENVVQKQPATTDTVANKGKTNSTKPAEKQCKSEMKTNDEDSSTSDEITLDLVRQNHLNEIKPEVLNSAGKQQLNAGSAKKKQINDSVDSQPESSSSSDDSKNKTVTKSQQQQKQKLKNIATKNNVKVKPKMVVVKKRVLKNSKVKNKDLEHEQRARRMKLFGFWSGPKRHRVASLNALAKVHCLYENESRGLFELLKRRKSSSGDNKTNSESESTNVPSPPTRTLRSGPGMRGVGKHWDMHNASFSSSEESSSGHESSVESNGKMLTPPPSYKQKQKEVAETKKVVKKPNKVVNKADTVKKKRNRTEIMMDLKDMVVRKRMASLNATAILAASYSAEKRPGKTDTDDSDETDLDSDVSSSHPSDSKRRCYESDVKEEEDRKVIEVHTTPNNKKVAVIVNQDTDVTITGVYVNSTTRSTHHEGYCSIAGMQYRISATSHTQTAATAVATETLLHPVPPPTSQAQQSPPQQASEHVAIFTGIRKICLI